MPPAAPADHRRLQRTEHPGIYRRGTRHVLIWRHNGRQHKRSFPTLDQALAEQARHRDGHTHPRGQHALLLRNYAHDWLDTHAGHHGYGLADSTRADYRHSLEKHILPRLGSMHLASIRARDVRGLVRDMEKQGLKPATINKHLAALKSLYVTAVADRETTSNPAARVFASSRNRAPDSTLPKALTTTQVQRLLQHLDPPWDLMAEFLVHTGLRISEAIALTWADLDLQEPRACVRVTKQYFQGRLTQPKSRRGIRTIPLSPGMTARLAEQRDSRQADTEDLVFPDSRGHQLDPHNLRARIIRPAAQAAGLPRVTPHMLRHTCASLLYENGRNTKQVQEWLGHSDAATTLRIYIHLADKGIGDATIFDQLELTGG